MILAAGLGTRLKPLTDTMPKALVPVNGQPLLDLNIHRLMGQGYGRFVVNVHHFAQQIVDHVACQDYTSLVQFSDETSQLLETGGALKKAQSLFDPDEPVLIHNVDIFDDLDSTGFAANISPTTMPCCWSADARPSATCFSTTTCAWWDGPILRRAKSRVH